MSPLNSIEFLIPELRPHTQPTVALHLRPMNIHLELDFFPSRYIGTPGSSGYISTGTSLASRAPFPHFFLHDPLDYSPK